MPEWIQGTCDVCKLLDGDIRPKKVTYCDFCGANICEKDLYSTRRVQAMLKAKGLSIEGLKNWIRTH